MHDYRDVGGRATQETKPRSNFQCMPESIKNRRPWPNPEPPVAHLYIRYD
jgi:hypothetical protein